jgi:hypothetical protein
LDAELDRICRDDYLGELTGRPIDEVRRMRSECQAVETGLSYLRRLVQGRLDIVAGELQRRRDGGDPADVSTLIGQLPDILAERTRAPGSGRLPQHLAPGDVGGALQRELDEIVSTGHLDALPEAGDDQLAEMRDRLERLERTVSARRRTVFQRIDALQAELTRRYRTGEASVETLLQ